MQDMIRTLLKINCGKTKILSLTGGAHITIEVAGHQIEAVDRFTYFGNVVAAIGGTDMDIENRINKARAAFGMLSVVWRNNNLSTSFSSLR